MFPLADPKIMLPALTYQYTSPTIRHIYRSSMSLMTAATATNEHPYNKAVGSYHLSQIAVHLLAGYLTHCSTLNPDSVTM